MFSALHGIGEGILESVVAEVKVSFETLRTKARGQIPLTIAVCHAQTDYWDRGIDLRSSSDYRCVFSEYESC